MKRLMIVLALGGLTLAACGSDDNATTTTTAKAATTKTTTAASGGSGAPIEATPQAIASVLAGQLDDAGIDADKDCILDAAKQLSHADLATIASDPNADLSPEGEATSNDAIKCVDFSDRTRNSIADLISASELGAGASAAQACVRGIFADADENDLIALLNSDDGALPANLKADVKACAA